MANRYSIYTASFGYGESSVLNLTQLRSQNMEIGANKTVVRPGGSLDAGAHYLGTLDPKQMFASRDLFSVLSAVSLSAGLYCANGSTMRFQLRDQAGAFITNSSHQTLTTTRGWLGIESFGVDKDSVEGAEMSLKYVPLFDGTNPIVVQNASVSLSGVAAPAAVSVYYHGPAYYNGSQLTGLISTRVTNGINFKTTRSDGDVPPRDGGIYARDPRIELKFLKVELGATASLFGVALAGAIDCYFLRGAPGARLPTGSGGNHLKVSAATGEMGTDTLEVSGEDDATITVTVRPTGVLSMSLGSNLP